MKKYFDTLLSTVSSIFFTCISVYFLIIFLEDYETMKKGEYVYARVHNLYIDENDDGYSYCAEFVYNDLYYEKNVDEDFINKYRNKLGWNVKMKYSHKLDILLFPDESIYDMALVSLISFFVGLGFAIASVYHYRASKDPKRMRTKWISDDSSYY